MTRHINHLEETREDQGVEIPIRHHGQDWQAARDQFNETRQAALLALASRHWHGEASPLND